MSFKQFVSVLFILLCLATNGHAKEPTENLALKVYSVKIDNISTKVNSNQPFKIHEYEELRHQTLETIDALNNMRKQVASRLDQSTKAEREKLEKLLQNIDELILVANNILKQIDKKKIHYKLKQYFIVQIPLYKPGTLERAYKTGSSALVEVGHRVYISFWNLAKSITVFPYFLYWIGYVVLIGALIPLTIHGRNQIIKHDDKVTFLRKIKTFIVYFATGCVYPLIVVGGLFLISFLTEATAFPMDEIVAFYLMITFIWISILFTSHLINPKEFKWGLVPVTQKRAHILSRGIYLFLIFLAIRLWFNEINNPPEFSQYLTLISQILLSIQTFFILGITRINRFSKTIIAIFALAAPFLIFMGLGNLAGLILTGTVETVVILLILKGIIYSIKRAVRYILKSSNSLFTNKQASDKASEMMIYWVSAFFNAVLFLVALYLILLSWGIDHSYLNDGVRRILFGFKIGSHTISLVNLVSAIVVFLVLFLLTRYIQNVLTKHVFPYTNFDSGVKHALRTTAGYIGFTIAVVTSIRTLGINLSSILYVIGGLSVGIGLGLQPIVTNFISGLIMLLERPIKIGDMIELGGEMGVVKRINVRTTEVENFEKCSVLYPNTQVINTMVKNWTKHNRVKRIEVTVGVEYGVDTKLVEKTLLECGLRNHFVTQKPAPYVIFTEIGTSSLNFSLRCYVSDVDDIFNAGNSLRHEVIAALKEKQITIAYPQTDVHFDDEFLKNFTKDKP